MYINLTIEAGGRRTDVSADGRRRISELFLLLRENGKVGNGEEPAYFRSALLGKLVSANETLLGAGVVDGDLLIADELWDGNNENTNAAPDESAGRGI